MTATVRDAVLDVLRHTGMTRIFANPGSTEVAFLTDLPEDLDFILALHEGSVVGMASGHALASGGPSVVLLHTTAGLGNAVGALATARTNRAPLVVLVGQQDRRHLAFEPFLAGHLSGLAGEYPVACHEPARPADVPGAVMRAWHEARLHRGPAIVTIPMSDWDEPAETGLPPATPGSLHTASGPSPEAAGELTELLAAAENPVLVVGPGADDPRSRDLVARIAGRLDCEVWQAAYASQAGFDHSDPRFAGHLPPGRGALREALKDHDTVLIVGAPAFRSGAWEPGGFVTPGTRVAVVTPFLDEALHSAADLAIVGDPAEIIEAILPAIGTAPSARADSGGTVRTTEVHAARAGQALTARDVFEAVAERLPAESTFIEETPSSRRALLDTVPARECFGFLTIAQGGLGFALPAATGIKLARPDRPVVAFVGDGASLYSIQSLWSAQRYGAGALYVVLSNGGYAVMNMLAASHGGKPPWPGFEEISVSAIARGFGCPARRIENRDELLAALDDIVPGLANRTGPLVLDVAVQAQPSK
ncbi:MAG: thiamine pyrophosphate-binding protein [Streptosporangiales bacterium]|nr:thiamine pyrophosphate-binding protein [Streptosporangiales bacterium]